MNQYVKFRASLEEKVQIEKNARQLNLSTSEYLRKMGLYGFAFQYDGEILSEIVKAMNRIGTNINQIAKVCNQSQLVSPQSLEALQIQHAKLLTLILENIVADGNPQRLIKILKRS